MHVCTHTCNISTIPISVVLYIIIYPINSLNSLNILWSPGYLLISLPIFIPPSTCHSHRTHCPEQHCSWTTTPHHPWGQNSYGKRPSPQLLRTWTPFYFLFWTKMFLVREEFSWSVQGHFCQPQGTTAWRCVGGCICALIHVAQLGLKQTSEHLQCAKLVRKLPFRSQQNLIFAANPFAPSTHDLGWSLSKQKVKPWQLAAWPLTFLFAHFLV